MFGASIAIVEETEVHPEHAGLLPVGLQALLIADHDTAAARDSSASTSSSAALTRSGSSIASMYVELPPIDQLNQPVAKEGFLHKVGGNIKSWKTRYFRLCPGRLLYFKDGENLSAEGRLGSVLLPGASIAIFSSDVYPGHPFCFGLTPVDVDRQYVFDCDSTQHRTEWITALTGPTRQRIRVSSDSLREGYLTKLGAKVKNWKTRFFILTKTSLKYFPNYTDLHDCLGTINLAGGFVVGGDDSEDAINGSSDTTASSPASSSSPTTSATIPSSLTYPPNLPYHFSLRAHGSDRTYIFCTTTKADRDGWLLTLQEIQKNVRI